jgi:hypothetical protein
MPYRSEMARTCRMSSGTESGEISSRYFSRPAGETNMSILPVVEPALRKCGLNHATRALFRRLQCVSMRRQTETHSRLRARRKSHPHSDAGEAEGRLVSTSTGSPNTLKVFRGFNQQSFPGQCNEWSSFHPANGALQRLAHWTCPHIHWGYCFKNDALRQTRCESQRWPLRHHRVCLVAGTRCFRLGTPLQAFALSPASPGNHTHRQVAL